MKMKKAILVGRHDAQDNMGYDEIVPKNILFSLIAEDIDQQVCDLIDEAIEQDADIILQNVPTVLAGALLRYPDFASCPVRIFGIVSKPGPRASGVSESFVFDDPADAEKAARAVKHANGRAKVEVSGHIVTVTVDPVPQFEFVRLERLL